MLFSEPKIPQSFKRLRRAVGTFVSVLFSEPKIPQSPHPFAVYARWVEFQCSSASRKFLNISVANTTSSGSGSFQCSSASRKFLNDADAPPDEPLPSRVSVLFSEPKIPQCCDEQRKVRARPGFSALERAENSSMQHAFSRRCSEF